MSRIVERAGCTENFWFFDCILDFNAKFAAVAEGFFDGFGLVMKIDNDICETEFGDVFGDVSDKRFSEKGNGRFGAIDG